MSPLCERYPFALRVGVLVQGCLLALHMAGTSARRVCPIYGPNRPDIMQPDTGTASIPTRIGWSLSNLSAGISVLNHAAVASVTRQNCHRNQRITSSQLIRHPFKKYPSSYTPDTASESIVCSHGVGFVKVLVSNEEILHLPRLNSYTASFMTTPSRAGTVLPSFVSN